MDSNSWSSQFTMSCDQTPNLAHYSSYPESALVPTANLMLNYILKLVRHPSFFKKYVSKKFVKVSDTSFSYITSADKWIGECLCSQVGSKLMGGGYAG